MGVGIIARIVIGAAVCGAAYFGFVAAAPADGSVGASAFPHVLADLAPDDAPDQVGTTANALARLKHPAAPAVTGGNARLRALFQGFEEQGIGTGTQTRMKAPAINASRAAKANAARPKSVARAHRAARPPSLMSTFNARRPVRATSPWDALNDLRRNKVSIVRTRPKMYRPFEGKYLFHVTAERNGSARPPEPAAVQSVKSEYRRRWWQ